MENLEKAKKIEMEINYCIKNNSFGGHYKDFIEQARELLRKSQRGKYFYHKLMFSPSPFNKEDKGFVENEEVIKICEGILK